MENQPEATEPTQTKKSRSKFTKALMLLGFAGVVGMGAGIFAADINIGNASGGAIEFGTGNVLISSCVSELEVDLSTAFMINDNPTYFQVDDILITELTHTCSNGESLTASLVNSSGGILGSYNDLITGTSPTTLTFDASSDEVDSNDVEYVLIETSN